MLRSASVVLVSIGASTASADPLELTIDLSAQTFDWIDGTSITQGTGLDDNRFGVISGLPADTDVQITTPLAAYTGDGSLSGVIFNLSMDGSAIDGLAFQTTSAPGAGATLSGDGAGPATGAFTIGSFTDLGGLTLGSYVLAPQGPWDGGVQINVVPAPGAAAFIGLAGLAASRRRRLPNSHTA